jgi:membrane-bound lytic murein transglycosylase B
MRRFTTFLALLLCGGTAMAQAPDDSARPPGREALSEAEVQTPATPQPGSDAGLRDWVADFRPRALAAGITEATFDAAMTGVTYDAKVVERDRNQAEFTKTVWDYLDTAVSDLRVTNGRAALARMEGTLTAIEAEYAVDKEVLVAIWGLESAYGTFRGSDSVVTSLAALAYNSPRAAFFESELLEALRILDAGDTTPELLQGSWAGAMGHTQFMPSSFAEHAVDHDGDGRRDIWGEDPTDALASSAAYLKFFGWQLDQPWGVEVTLPEGFDYLLADREVHKLPSEWKALGVTGIDGEAVPDHGPASVLLPGGEAGAAFMIFDNFEVIEHYNTADAYVIGIGHLADRIAGGGPIRHGWPRETERALTYDERVELQQRLTAAGFDTVKIDAKMGPLTVDAIRRFQDAQGIVADGFPSVRLLDRLRAL